MFTFLDLPIIIALFAATFGTLGLISMSIPALRRNIPNLSRGSLFYLLSAALLLGGVYFKNSSSSTLLSADIALADASSSSKSRLINVQIQPHAFVAIARPVIISPELEVAVSTVQINMVSDPIEADVFINGKLRGQTPLTLHIPKNTLIEYRVTASPDAQTGTRYAPFQGFIHQDKSSDISVWLERIYQ